MSCASSPQRTPRSDTGPRSAAYETREVLGLERPERAATGLWREAGAPIAMRPGAPGGTTKNGWGRGPIRHSIAWAQQDSNL